MQPWWRSSFVLGVVVATGALSSSAFASSTALPVGPGPRTPYVVQSQPAPGHCHYRHTHSGQPLPDIRCTPGSTNPRVTQSNLHRTICKSGYSSSIRPPESVTAVEKKANARSYAYKGSLTQTEYDHLVSLELGGDPNDPRNLWVEPPSPGHRLSQTFRNPKDTVENEAHALICSGAVRLVPMQRAMAKDWTTALAVVGDSQAGSSGSPSGGSGGTGAIGVPKGTPFNFSNCTALRAKFPHGVGRVGAHDHTSGSSPVTNFTRSNAWYHANQSHDRDHDGIACEHH
jgi:hypothetical protein